MLIFFWQAAEGRELGGLIFTLPHNLHLQVVTKIIGMASMILPNIVINIFVIVNIKTLKWISIFSWR